MKDSERGSLARHARNHVSLLWRMDGRAQPHGRRIALHVEKLESRTLLAGDLASVDPVDEEILDEVRDESDIVHTMGAGDMAAGDTDAGDTDAGDTAADDVETATEVVIPAIDLILELTDLEGNQLDALAPGQDFVLHVYSTDLRAVDAEGVFAAYLDIHWDSALAVATGDLQFGDTFPNVHDGDASSPGLIDEAGAVAGLDEIGVGPHEVFSIALRATASGELIFSSDAADESGVHDMLAYGYNEPVPLDNVNYGSIAISISPAAAPSEKPIEVTMSATGDAAEATSGFLDAASTNTDAPVDQTLALLILSTLGPDSIDSPVTSSSGANKEQLALSTDANGSVQSLLLIQPLISLATGQGDADASEKKEEPEDIGLNIDLALIELL